MGCREDERVDGNSKKRLWVTKNQKQLLLIPDLLRQRILTEDSCSSHLLHMLKIIFDYGEDCRVTFDLGRGISAGEKCVKPAR
jgi:hypothetical protein